MLSFHQTQSTADGPRRPSSSTKATKTATAFPYFLTHSTCRTYDVCENSLRRVRFQNFFCVEKLIQLGANTHVFSLRLNVTERRKLPFANVLTPRKNGSAFVVYLWKICSLDKVTMCPHECVFSEATPPPGGAGVAGRGS